MRAGGSGAEAARLRRLVHGRGARAGARVPLPPVAAARGGASLLPTAGRARGRRRAAAAPPPPPSSCRLRAEVPQILCTYLPRHTRWWQAGAASFPCSLRQDSRARAAPRSQDAQVRPRTSTTGAKRVPSRGGVRCTAAPARCTAFRVRAPLRGCAPRRGAEPPLSALRRRRRRVRRAPVGAARRGVRPSAARPLRRARVRARCVRVLCCGAWRRGSSPFTGAPPPAIFPAWLSIAALQQM